jgi:putative MFS transporter
MSSRAPIQSRQSMVDDARLNPFHIRLAIYSSGGPFLDGYVLSIIGVAMVQLTPSLHLTTTQQGLLGASALIGIFFGAPLGGWATDRFGRQTLYTIDLLAIVGCSVAQFWAEDFWTLFLLRLLIGMAVGADYPIATSLLTEFTPRKNRGPLVAGLMMAWFVGAAAAYIVGELLLHVGGDGWRWMLLSAAFPATIIVLFRRGTPESPRWLASKGRDDEANQVVQQIFGPGASVTDIPAETKSNASIVTFARSGYFGRMIFVAAFWTCSIIPLFAVYAFGPQLMQALNLDNADMENYGAAAITILFTVGCFAAVLLVNKLGRRRLLIHSFTWSGLALLLLGLFPHAHFVFIACCFAAYALFIGGSQVLQFVYPNELFPTDIRGTAVGLASSLSRIGAAIGTYLVPVSLSDLGIGYTMSIGAGVTLIGCIIALKWAPETCNLPLHEASALKPKVN